MDSLPLHSEDLVEALASLFPARCIREGETLEQAHRYAAKRELVEYLMALSAASPPPTARP